MPRGVVTPTMLRRSAAKAKHALRSPQGEARAGPTTDEATHGTATPTVVRLFPTAAERRATHAANQRWHFKKRLRQRFGLAVDDVAVATLAWRIRENKPGVLFLALRRRSSAWRVKWQGHTLVVLYDHTTDQLVTAYSYKPWKWRNPGKDSQEENRVKTEQKNPPRLVLGSAPVK